jgi:hypothetical protein
MREKEVYACIRKEMGIVFSVLIVVREKRGASLCVRPLSSRIHLSRELLGEALFLGPLVVVGGSVLFEDLHVLGDEILAAVGADGHGLRGLDGSSVLVDLDTSASSVSLLVLALDTVLLGDRHGEGWCCVGLVLWLLLCLLSCGGREVGCRKLGDTRTGKSEDPSFTRKFLVQ